MNPKLSIILPVFNGERYLQRSIDSVLSQSHGDFELIIWNDASIDTSSQIIQSYEDKRIRVFQNELNQGLFRTLNLAIDRAKSDWVKIWSQDDLMREDCLAVKMKLCKQFPEVGMGFCSYDVIDKSGTVIFQVKPSPDPIMFFSESLAQLFFYRGCMPGNISTVIIRKAALNDVGRFNINMQIAGDFEMWVRISKKYPLYYLEEPLIQVRSHAGQLSRRDDSYVICIREEKIIYKELLRRIPAEIVDYARWYDCLTRQPKYVHYMMKRALAADFGNAKGAFKEIMQMDYSFLAVGFWLLTANLHLFKMKPKYRTQMGDSTFRRRPLSGPIT